MATPLTRGRQWMCRDCQRTSLAWIAAGTTLVLSRGMGRPGAGATTRLDSWGITQVQAQQRLGRLLAPTSSSPKSMRAKTIPVDALFKARLCAGAITPIPRSEMVGSATLMRPRSSQDWAAASCLSPRVIIIAVRSRPMEPSCAGEQILAGS